MQTQITTSAVFAICATLALAGCGHKDKGAANGPAAPNTPAPTFADISPILVQKCSPCHSGADDKTAFVTNEANFKAVGADASKRIVATDKTQMPLQHHAPALTDGEKTTLLTYLGKVQPPPPLAAAAVTYDDISPIVAAKCSKCHGDSGRPSMLKFAGHEDVIQANSDAIATRVASTDIDQVMPPVDKELSDDQKAKILAYLSAQGLNK